jgi:hypothetical protein
MTLLEKEIETSYYAFQAEWTAQATQNWQELKGRKEYTNSYSRICCFHAWRNEITIPSFGSSSGGFLLEAHNDLLVSHVNASFGAWRSALKALRSLLENTLCGLYYKDHPVELELWLSGKFRISFSDLYNYFIKHPSLAGISRNLIGLDVVSQEYSTLSKAVHASTIDFRMTDRASTVLLWSQQKSKCSMWQSREKRVVESVCLLMICLFKDELQGTKKTALREMLYFALSPSKRALVKGELHITIPPP